MKLTRIDISGFKGTEAIYDLTQPLVLHGPNGSGKSTVLEAIRFALTGAVPTGKTNDEVARYFPPTGGGVRLTGIQEDPDGETRWISRTVQIDHEKNSVTIQALADRKDASGKPDFRPFDVAASAIDVGAFLALSQGKRREFVMNLVAGSKEDDGTLLEFVEERYAKELGGDGSKAEILKDWSDLATEKHRVAEIWHAGRGLRQILSTTTGDSAAELCQEYAAVAKSERLGAGRSHKEAISALRLLEQQVKGVEPTAVLYDKRKADVDRAQVELRTLHEQWARRQELGENFKRERGYRAEARDQLEAAKKLRDKLGASKEKPKITADKPDGQEEGFVFQVAEAEKELEAVHERAEKQRALKGKLEELVIRMDVREREKKEIEEDPWSLVWAQLVKMTETDPPTSTQLAPYNTALALVKKNIPDPARLEEIAKELNTASAQRTAATIDLADIAAFAKADSGDESLREKRLTSELAATRDALSHMQNARTGLLRIEEDDITKWQIHKGRIDSANEAVLNAAGSVNKREEGCKSAEKVYQGMEQVDLGAAEKNLADLELSFEDSHAAQGKLAAYEEAKWEAEKQKTREAAWKLAEKAIKTAREEFVSDVMQPLREDLQRLLAFCSRAEIPYVRLENSRGAPIFELGWTSEGSDRALSALSGGETAIFLFCLNVVLASRVGGLQVFLIEADPLDGNNLQCLLEAALLIVTDATVIATSTPISQPIKGLNLVALS